MLQPDLTHSEAELERVRTMQQPHPNLLWYYGLASLVVGPVFPVVLLPLYFRYHTLRYRFEAEGVQMSWGVLFRREVSLAYARIQDIHLRSNFIERWLGLARIQISTASGNVSAEMTIEGLPEFELVRDFLYTRMRGATASAAAVRPAAAGSPDPLVAALRAVSEDLRAVRAALEAKPPR